MWMRWGAESRTVVHDVLSVASTGFPSSCWAVFVAIVIVSLCASPLSQGRAVVVVRALNSRVIIGNRGMRRG